MSQVSVLLPIFNGEQYLADALGSLADQTFSDFEVIICDDLSSDRGAEIVKEFALKDSRFQYVLNRDQKGLFGNYNECLSRSKGKYVKPFAQDDLLAPTALEKMVEVLERSPEVALLSVARRCPGLNSKDGELIRPFSESRAISAKETIRDNLIKLTNWVGEPSTVLFRREHAGTGFNTAYFHFGDLEYWFRILQHGDFFYLDDILSSFRRHSSQATSANLGGMYFAVDLLKLSEQYWSYLEEAGETRENFYKTVMDKVAVEVDHLVRNEGLDAEKVRQLVAHKHRTAGLTVEEALESINDFKELSFRQAHLIHSLNRELYELGLVKDRWYRELSRLELLESQMKEIKSSSSWMITAPLRKLASFLHSPVEKTEHTQ